MKQTKKLNYFWSHLGNLEANIWVTTLVVLAVITFIILVVTLPGQGLRSDASFFRTKTTTSTPLKVIKTKPVPIVTPTVPTSPSSGGPDSTPPVPPRGSGTPPSPSPSGSAVVNSPVASSQWPIWSIQTIRWNFPSAQGIGLMLKKGDKVLDGDAGVIAWPRTVRNPNGTYSSTGGMLRNNGAFNWVVNPNLSPGNDYQVQILDMQGKVLGESPKFSITSAYAGVRIIAPTSGMNVRFGEDQAVEWSPGRFPGHLDIAVYVKSSGYNGLGYVATNIPTDWLYILPNGNGLFTWSVSNNLLSQANGNGGTLKVGDEVELILSDRDNPAHSAHVPVRIVQ